MEVFMRRFRIDWKNVALGAVGTEIHHLISLFLQSLDYRRLVFHARVVATYSYFHDIQSFLKIP